MAVTIILTKKPGVDLHNQKCSREDGAITVSDTSYSWSQKLPHIYDDPTIQGSPNGDSGVGTSGIC